MPRPSVAALPLALFAIATFVIAGALLLGPRGPGARDAEKSG